VKIVGKNGGVNIYVLEEVIELNKAKYERQQ
jgi:hypothetical protein